MRWNRLVATATVVLSVALGGLVAPGQAALATPPPPDGGLPYGYGEVYASISSDVLCELHLDDVYDIDYHSSFYGVRALFIRDGVFADGDYCRVGNYYLEQKYGVLALWKNALSPDGDILWCMCWKDSRAYSSTYAYFQGFDGNLVSYNGGGGAVGATDTCCIKTPYMPILSLQSDGNLVVYWYNAITHVYEVKFATNTAGR
ncbi:hypothetical protein [Hamadaea tsunoensis]|uniref:hypothetical protein n=1 Tax=Hamadaea tsunoensis TaxID=53368 RepID=UPI0004221477|nr:hypothetical protein [Hamadaea tsunoensis]